MKKERKRNLIPATVGIYSIFIVGGASILYSILLGLQVYKIKSLLLFSNLYPRNLYWTAPVKHWHWQSIMISTIALLHHLSHYTLLLVYGGISETTSFVKVNHHPNVLFVKYIKV